MAGMESGVAFSGDQQSFVAPSLINTINLETTCLDQDTSHFLFSDDFAIRDKMKPLMQSKSLSYLLLCCLTVSFSTVTATQSLLYGYKIQLGNLFCIIENTTQIKHIKVIISHCIPASGCSKRGKGR